MKREDASILLKNLEEKKDFKVIYDGKDFGVFHYAKEHGIYQGDVGFLKIESMLRAIKDESYFIKLELVER